MIPTNSSSPGFVAAKDLCFFLFFLFSLLPPLGMAMRLSMRLMAKSKPSEVIEDVASRRFAAPVKDMWSLMKKNKNASGGNVDFLPPDLGTRLLSEPVCLVLLMKVEASFDNLLN